MNLFTEISATNRAYCASRGLTSAEMYGTPINEAEREVSRLIAAGVPSESAGLFAPARIEAERVRMRKIVAHQQRVIRLRNRGYAPGAFKEMVNRENSIKRGAA